MRSHVQILAILNIAWGIIGLIAALVIILIFGGAMGIIGMASHEEAAAGIAIPIVGLIGAIIFFVIFVTSLPSFVIGLGLLRCARWSRIAGIILSAIHLINIPFGTALGIYGLWVLLSSETLPLFEPQGSTSPIHVGP